MRLDHPGFLFLLLLLPLLLWYLARKNSGRIRFSDLSIGRQIAPSFWVRSLPFLNFARFLVIVLMIFALARPQSSHSREQITSEGIDILLILDISGSMRAEDFKPDNRLHAAKAVIHDFLDNRQNDRIGLVVFAGESFTQCPLTLDYQVLGNLLLNVEIGMLEDGTAIGDALANATNRLRHSTAKSKIAILLTDGENNAGTIDPLTAAQAAKALGIKVYTIGMGKEGGAFIHTMIPFLGCNTAELEPSLMKKRSNRSRRLQTDVTFEQLIIRNYLKFMKRLTSLRQRRLRSRNTPVIGNWQRTPYSWQRFC